jgi:hypothetical protein
MDFQENNLSNNMKISGLLFMFIFLPSILIAQELKKDSNFCKCQYNLSVNYPDIPEENKLQ